MRGLAVLLGRAITSPAALAAFHRRFTDAGPFALALVVACELLIAVAFAAVLSLWLGLPLALWAVRWGWRARRRHTAAAAGLVLLAAHVHGVDMDGDDPRHHAAVPGHVVLAQVGVVLGPDACTKARSSSGATTAVPRISR